MLTPFSALQSRQFEANNHVGSLLREHSAVAVAPTSCVPSLSALKSVLLIIMLLTRDHCTL